MASVFKRPGNRYWIQATIYGADGKRKRVTWRLGKVLKKTADDFKMKLEVLIEHVENDISIPVEIQNWLSSLSDKHQKWLETQRLYKFGGDVSAPKTLKLFIDFCIDHHYKGSPVNTVRNMRTGGNAMIDYFGEKKQLRHITTGDFEVWRTELLDGKFSDANVAFILKKARRFMSLAVMHRVVQESSFSGIKIPSEKNKSREVYISVDMIRQLLRSCSPEWQAIVCLSRFGGIRCPSDVCAIEWDRINFEEKRLTIFRQKTNRDIAIPMMPELEHALRKLWDCSEGNTTNYLFPNYANNTSDRAIYAQLKRLIIRSGLTPWPKITTNMRISWAQDLKVKGIAPSTIAYWMDHTEEVHKDHYEIVESSEYDAATKIDSGLFKPRPIKKRSNSKSKAKQKAKQPDSQNP